MNYHHTPQDLIPPQDFQVSQEEQQQQAISLNFNAGPLQEPQGLLPHSHTPSGSASPWDATTPLNETPLNEELLQMNFLFQHQQHDLFQQQPQPQVHMTPSGFTSPPQPPIATLSPEQMYAHSPLSASTSAPSPAHFHYDPPPVVRIPERKRRVRQPDTSKTQAQIGAEQSAPQQEQSLAQSLLSQQDVRLSKKQVSAGGGLQIHRVVARAHPSVRSGGSLVQNSPDLGLNAFSSPLGRKAGKASSSKADVRAHPYTHARRAISGPVSTINTSVSGGSASYSPASACVHSPAHSLPHLSPASNASHDAHIPPPATAPASISGSASIPQVKNIHKYLCRTDLYVDLKTKIVTASLEVPGISLKNIRISLSKDRKTKQALLVIQGRNFTLLPDGSPFNGEKADLLKEEGKGMFLWCERKCGDFRRILSIPNDIKKEQIKLQLLNGILFVSYPADANVLAVAQAQYEALIEGQLQPQAESVPRTPQMQVVSEYHSPAPSSSGSVSGKKMA